MIDHRSLESPGTSLRSLVAGKDRLFHLYTLENVFLCPSNFYKIQWELSKLCKVKHLCFNVKNLLIITEVYSDFLANPIFYIARKPKGNFKKLLGPLRNVIESFLKRWDDRRVIVRGVSGVSSSSSYDPASELNETQFGNLRSFPRE